MIAAKEILLLQLYQDWIFTLKEEQSTALKASLGGKDVPTGFGRSLV